MASKKQSFELTGPVVLSDGKRQERGVVLELDIDEDGRVTDPIYRNRVRRLNVATPVAGSDGQGAGEMSVKEARGEAKKIIDGAKEEAKAILAKAKEDAGKVAPSTTPPPPVS